MKPSRKLNRGSFMARISGGGDARARKGAAVHSDHDLAGPPGKQVEPSDSDRDEKR